MSVLTVNIGGYGKVKAITVEQAAWYLEHFNGGEHEGLHRIFNGGSTTKIHQILKITAKSYKFVYLNEDGTIEEDSRVIRGSSKIAAHRSEEASDFSYKFLSLNDKMEII